MENLALKIDEADRYKTTFKSHHGLYRLVQIPFVLYKALGTFRGEIEVILSNLKCQYALMYLVYIVLFDIRGRTYEASETGPGSF